MSTSRKLLIAAAVIVVLPLIALAVLPFVVDANRYRPTVQQHLAERLQCSVSIGNMQLRTFPLSVRVADLVIGQPSGITKVPPMLQVKDASVGVAFLPLIFGNLKIGTAVLTSPQIELVRTASGKWNYEAATSSKSTSESGSQLTLDELTIRDGRVAITDLAQKKPRDVYEHIDLDLRGPDAAQRGSVTGSVRLDSIAAVVKVQSDFQLGDAASARGKLTVSADRSKEPLNVDFDVNRPNASSPLNIKMLSAKIGSLSASATGFVNLQQTPSGLAVHVKTERAPIADVTRLASLFGATFPADLKVDGNVQSDLDITGNTDKPKLAGKIEATQAVIRSKELIEPVRASELLINLTPDSLQTQPFTLETGNTKLSAQLTATGYSSPTPQLSATLRTNGARVEELLRMATAYGLKPPGLNGTGLVNLDMKITQAGKTLAYSGAGSLKEVSLNSPDLPGPLSVSTADIRFSDDRVVLDALQAALGNMHAAGSLSLRDFTHPNIQFNLHVDQVDVNQLTKTRTTASPGTGKAQSSPATLTNLAANGAIAIDRLQYEQSVLSNLKATVALAGGVLKLDPVTAGLFGGQVAGSITADLRKPVTAYGIDTKLTGVESGQLLAAISSVKNISGPLSGATNLTFLTKPGEDIAASLNGTVHLQMGPGRISGVQILNQMAAIGRFAGVTGKQEAYTNINKLEGTLDIRNGLATTNDLLLDLGGATMTGTGSMGFADQSLSLNVTTTISRDYAQRNLPGSVGGMLSTVLASPKGDLVIPALVSGTFAQPRFAPDTAEMAKLKLKGLTGGQPSVQGFVDALTGKQPSGGNQPAGSQQGAGFGDLLKRFQKKK